MKVVNFLFLLGVVFVTQNSNAQSCKELPTSLEEYNYIVKGYKIQLENGLDMKKGYTLKDIFEESANGRKVIFKELVKEEKDLRAIMAIFTGLNGVTSYFCIPLGADTSNLLQSYTLSIQNALDNTIAMNFYQTSLTKVLNYYILK